MLIATLGCMVAESVKEGLDPTVSSVTVGLRGPVYNSHANQLAWSREVERMRVAMKKDHILLHRVIVNA
jgi:hypothetical protein